MYKSSGGEVFFHNTRVLSDIKAAKQEFKETIATLKQELELGNLNQEDFNVKKVEAQKILKEAKRDSNFENIIDENGKRAIKEIETFDEYQTIIDKYSKRLSDAQTLMSTLTEKLTTLDAKDDKETYNQTKKELSEAKKELSLSKLRQKQYISNLKYRLIHKNKLLMRRMQMIFQDPIASLNPRMTVKEIIAEGLRINGFKNEEVIEQRVVEALETVGLVAEHASRYPHEFSGGKRQRIGIARSLVVEPTFIIADEPISALDVSIRAHIINLLNELREEKGITILFIAHDLSVVKYFSDRLAVMYFGKIVEIGDKEKIFSHPMHPYTLSLLDSIPLPDPLYEQRRQASKRYNPMTAHDYSQELPILREIEPDHLVLCNTEEYNKYMKLLGK